MSLRVYNTLSRTKEPFEPITPGKVGIYLCGPTVYDSPHIGHLVGPVIFDAIKRHLTFRGFKVTWITNVTDVDDKIINKSNQTGEPAAMIAQKYEKEYKDALAMIGIDSIDAFPRASEHMAEMIAMSQKLMQKGFAYESDGNVWFDVSKSDGYGRLSGRTLDEQEGGTRDLAGAGKQDRADFALWKAVKPGEPAWESPWGPGRPGWHIECSAMSTKYLGDTFDIHGGGMDLMFPHHENELAQSECCTGKPFAKYWFHNGLTRIKTKAASGEWQDEKMSKSLGNVIRVIPFMQEHGPDTLRYLILSTHYRRPIEFSDDVVTNSKKSLSTFARVFERIERLGGALNDSTDLSASLQNVNASDFIKTIEGLITRFTSMMDDDFNTAGAIGVMHEVAGAVNGFVEQSKVETTKDLGAKAQATAGAQVLRAMAQLLGLFRVKVAEKQSDSLAGDLMQLIIQLRTEARKKKDYATSDAIRDGLAKLKITIEDGKDGTLWRKN